MIRYKVLSRRPDVERVEVFVFTFQSVHPFSRILVMGQERISTENIFTDFVGPVICSDVMPKGLGLV